MMHLGPRVTALVDGQLGRAEEERAWAHVHACPACRAAVEREGWIKRQVAQLSGSVQEAAPAGLKGSLAQPPPAAGALSRESPWPAWDATVEPHREARARRLGSLAALGAGSASAAMIGVIALGAAPAGTPVENPAPTGDLEGAAGPQVGSLAGQGASDREVTDAIRTVMSAFRLGQ